MIDVDAFRRVDGKPIEGHDSWWKIYSGSTAEVLDQGNDVRVSVVAKTAVTDIEFSKDPIVYDRASDWSQPIQIVTDVRRDKRKSIVEYHVSGVGWVDRGTFLAMTCRHEVDNARPVFPAGGRPFVRTKRDPGLANNISAMG